LAFLLLALAARAFKTETQEITQTSKQQTANQDHSLTIKVATEEVRLDAVVVDRKGRQITDLTVNDFEIYQDRRTQEIIQCRYISLESMQPGKETVSSSDRRGVATVPAPAPEREDIRRTIHYFRRPNDRQAKGIYSPFRFRRGQ